MALTPRNIQVLSDDLYGDSKNISQVLEIKKVIYWSPTQPFGRREQTNKIPKLSVRKVSYVKSTMFRFQTTKPNFSIGPTTLRNSYTS